MEEHIQHLAYDFLLLVRHLPDSFALRQGGREGSAAMRFPCVHKPVLVYDDVSGTLCNLSVPFQAGWSSGQKELYNIAGGPVIP